MMKGMSLSEVLDTIEVITICLYFIAASAVFVVQVILGQILKRMKEEGYE